MVTLVGTHGNFADALKDLVELEYDVIEAYEAAINRLDDTRYKDKLKEFKADHHKHLEKLSHLLRTHNEDIPKGPTTKQWITKGKVIMSNLIGDNAILIAMKSNEEDSNKAYEHMNAREDKWHDAEDFLKAFLDDEKRHKSWLESMTA